MKQNKISNNLERPVVTPVAILNGPSPPKSPRTLFIQEELSDKIMK